MLSTLLEEDERIECLIGCQFGPDLGQSKLDSSKHSGVGVATDRRVMLVDKGLFGSTEVAEMGFAPQPSVAPKICNVHQNLPAHHKGFLIQKWWMRHNRRLHQKAIVHQNSVLC